MMQGVCDVCGKTAPVGPAGKPDGWWTIDNDEDADVCSPECGERWFADKGLRVACH